MRPLLHLLSVVLVLPSVVFACAFIILGRAIATQSLLGLFDQLLADAVWLIPWGLLAGCAALFVIALGGVIAQSRWLAGLCVAALGIGSTVILLAITVSHSTASVGQLPFLVPGLVASGIGLWFALTEHPRRHNATSAA